MTMVTLDCTPFDIATSVSEKSGVVYSPAVLHPQGHGARQAKPLASLQWRYPTIATTSGCRGRSETAPTLA